ncbi:MAG: ATP-binding cassette domain-containing protein, partial [Undibacterium sp.]
SRVAVSPVTMRPVCPPPQGARQPNQRRDCRGIHTDTKIKALVLQEKRALKAAKLQGDRNGDKVAKIKALYRSKTAALNLKDDTKASELKAAIASLKLQEKEAIEADKFESQKGETNLEPIKVLYEKQITVLKGKVNTLMAEHKAAVTALAAQEKKDINLEVAKSKVMLLDLAKQKAMDEPQIADLKAKENEHVAEQKAIIAQINYDNRHVDPALMSEIQMIFQDPVDSLDPRMTVEDIIQEGLHIRHQYNREENHRKCVSMLERVGLIADYASRYPHEFSGGQRQRIGIARALIMDPKFLICDEPISALDVSIRAQIINLLNDLKNEMGLTLMFIAHDLSVVKYFCDRIAVMYFGNLVELAPSDELFAHPLHPYTRALLSAIPKPDPLSEKNRVRKIYNPAKEHDYSAEKPVLQEILPGHWILANAAEMAKYREMIKALDVK